VGHTLRSSDLFHMKASRASVSQFASKLVNARRQMVHVTPSRRSDGSMQWAASDPVTLGLLFLLC
jgi:hypothetical protein